jgi:hypothetical protein
MSRQSLALPEGMASISAFGQQYGENGVVRDVEPHIAREIMSHDPRIVAFIPGSDNDPENIRTAKGKRAQAIARLGMIEDRRELFNIARHMGVPASATLKNVELKEKLVNALAECPEDEIPLIVAPAGEAAPGTILADDVAAQANRGNDALGKQPARPAHAGGATFSQGGPSNHTPAPAPTGPAPSGAGLVTPTGTQQPPYNQLDTGTGKPTNDQGAAPYPLAVPPIDPETGLPYREGDPRIPEAARAPVRVEGDSVDHVDGVAEAVHHSAKRIDAAVEDVRASRKV